MDKPVKFFECLLPVSICNLHCPYCYIIQEDRRAMKYAKLHYSPQHIGYALRKERVGGCCWFSICGAGETMVQKELDDVVLYLLKEGHYVNITTNGTLTNRFRQLLKKCESYVSHLHFSFSFHYTELLRLNLLDEFFNNIIYVRNCGASFLYQMNLCDEYLPYIDEIKRISTERLGSYPQVALTRDESRKPFRIWTRLTNEEYFQTGHSFDSPLFDFTYKNFNVKRKEFCYAGEWSFILNLQTGWLSQCYANIECQNIFEDVNTPIKLRAVGKRCNNSYCVNSSHFISLGVIPELNVPSYANLRCRKGSNWYSDEMYSFLNSKLNESNKEYGAYKKWKINSDHKVYRKIRGKASAIKHKLIK